MNETAQEQEMLTRRLALVKAANAIQSDSLDAARMWLELADRIPARGWDSSGEV